MAKIKSPISLIKQGILNEDWKDVITGYQMLTGDESLSDINKEKVVEEIVAPKTKKQSTKKNKVSSKKSKRTKFALDDEEAIDKAILSKTKLVERKNWLVSGPVRMTGIKPQTPFNVAELVDEEEIAQNKKRVRKNVEVRDPYEPKIITCNSCGSKFDYNKAYHLGVLEANQSRIVCQKCQNNYRG